MHKKPSILLIGSGRLAKHLCYWNSLLDQPNTLLKWNRTQNQMLLNEQLENCEIVWLAISDSAIIDFYNSHPKLAEKKVLHFSGSVNDNRILCAHPLMSFPLELMENEVYFKIHFGLEGFSAPKEALPGFHNPYFILSTENKNFYHALCVMAGNFPQLLWNEINGELKKLAVPEAALDLYVEQIAGNFIKLKEKALTGPLVRKDYSTIERNISALEKTSRLQGIYQAFTKELSL